MKNSKNISGGEKSGEKQKSKKLLNQTEFAKKHGVKRQRVGHIIAQGDLMTEIRGKRIMVVDCKFNDDVIRDQCQGQGNWNRPRSGY